MDILDDTAPSWLKEHPNGPRAYMVAGGAFYAKIPVDGYFPDDPMQVFPHLSKLIIAAATQVRLNCAPQIVSRLTLFQRWRAMVRRRRFLILLWTSMRQKTTAPLSL